MGGEDTAYADDEVYTVTGTGGEGVWFHSDPGSRAEYENNSCDQKYDQSQLYADWLAGDSSNRLAILAGLVTEDAQNPDGQYAHAGIQNTLFDEIRGTALAEQVTVRNYPNLDHVPMYDTFRANLAGPKISSPDECPANPSGDSVVGWRP